MGLFASRPEEPTEWAGLPSEPFEQSATESIADGATSTTSASLLIGIPVESVVIPLPSVGETAEHDQG
ncbi:hypothetical protein [Microbacterium rhizomatis]|nr:hypothetical protein [Microbacterium rhizomatis]